MREKIPVKINNEPVISVLIPAFNASRYIAQAIKSIQDQTFNKIEIIIIDDSSTDSTWSIIKKCAAKDTRIRIFRNKTNLYIANVRNQLIGYARGKYIAWQDADDISAPDRLLQQKKKLDNDPRIGMVGGYLQFFEEPKGNISIRKYKTEDEEIRKTIFRYSPVAQPAAMIRRKCFEELGTYNPAFPPAEDIDMSFRIGTKYRFANIPHVVLKYRHHTTSATFNRLRHIELTTLRVRAAYRNNPAYRFTILDSIYNILQGLFVFIMPARIKIALFNRFRNTSL